MIQSSYNRLNAYNVNQMGNSAVVENTSGVAVTNGTPVGNSVAMGGASIGQAAGAQASTVAPVIGLGMIAALYFIFSYAQDKTGIAASLSRGNIKANLHNILVSTLAVIIGTNLFKILFGKMVESNVGIFQKIGGIFYPVVSNL